MEAKIKTPRNPWTENSPPKISCPNFRNWEFTRAKGDSYDDKAGRTMNKIDEKGRFMKWSLVRKASGLWRVCRTPGGGTQSDERLRPKGGTFFKSQVYERVGVSLGEVYKRVGKSVFPSVKRPKIANRRNIWLWKSRASVGLWFSHILKTVNLQQLKGMQCSNLGLWKGYHLVYKRVKGWTFGRSLPV